MDNRLFVNAVLWMLHSGARWSDLPEYYGRLTKHVGNNALLSNQIAPFRCKTKYPTSLSLWRPEFLLMASTKAPCD